MTCRAGVIASILIVFAVLSLFLNESAPPPAVHAPPEGAVFSYDAYAALLKTHVDAQGRQGRSPGGDIHVTQCDRVE